MTNRTALRCLALLTLSTALVQGSSRGLAAVDSERSAAGRVVWEDRGQPELQGYALDIGASEDVVVAAGGVADSNSTSQWYVRAVDRGTGAPKWEERFGAMTFGVAKEVAVSGDRAYVAGWTRLRLTGFNFDTRAYDLATGQVVWAQEVRLGAVCLDESPGFGRCVAKSLAVDGGRVFVVGHMTGPAHSPDFAVVAYDAATGALLWQSLTDPTGTGAPDFAWAVEAAGGSVFVVGEVGDFSELLLRSYDAVTGAIRWEQHIPGALDNTLKDTLRIDGSRVFVSGADADGEFAVWAYDQSTGEPLWSDHVEDGLLGYVQALALGTDGSNPRLFAVGLAGCDRTTGLACELAIRAYDPATGLVWERNDVARGGDWSFPMQVKTTEGRVVVTAAELLPDGLYHARLRTFLPSNGTSVGEISFDAGSNPYGFLDGLCTIDGETYASGILFTHAAGSGDWVLRRYQLR